MISHDSVSPLTGLAHLEALEMLSNQCERRVNALLARLPPADLAAIKPTLVAVRANCELQEPEEEVTEQEFELLVTECVQQLDVGVKADKLIKVGNGLSHTFYFVSLIYSLIYKKM